MTPTQSLQLSRVAAKHPEPGWHIEATPVHEKQRNWFRCDLPTWECSRFLYRAVGPRKRVELKLGMEVKSDWRNGLIYRVVSGEYPFIVAWSDYNMGSNDGEKLTHYRWPNGDGTWLPIEGEPEIISMEGVV